MAGFASQKPSAPITGINVTPLVDITLVLLVVFMVTAKLVISRAMPMDLPAAATGGEVQQILSLQLRADGSLQINGAPVSEDGSLVAQTRQARERNPELRAVIEAEGTVPHSRVVWAIDLLRQAGISRIAFGVMPSAPVVDPHQEVRGAP